MLQNPTSVTLLHGQRHRETMSNEDGIKVAQIQGYVAGELPDRDAPVCS